MTNRDKLDHLAELVGHADTSRRLTSRENEFYDIAERMMQLATESNLIDQYHAWLDLDCLIGD